MFFWLCAVLLTICLLSFVLSSEDARRAAVFAMPQRRSITQSKTVERISVARNIVRWIWAPVGRSEHVEGQIQLHQVDVDTLRTSPLYLDGLKCRILKRIFDVTVAGALLVFTFPLIVVVAILIKQDSPGPVLYRQTRVGRSGERFTLLKFRTMKTDAELNGAVWATKNDDRVTKIGKFLRKTRIDEIPQALTILSGKMSFVGPRPERPEFTEKLEKIIPHYAERQTVKPGLTGWAQVNFHYGASVEDAREKLKYDLYYIQNYSFLLDFFITIKTIRVALLGTGSR